MDPIANMLTIIRNGCRAGKMEVLVPHSRIKMDILRILLEEGFISNFTVDSEKKPREITVMLKYSKDGESVIRNLERISRSSLRRYVSKNEIPTVLGGLGIAILTTSKGLMTDREARRRKIGGEIVAHVY